MECYYEALNRGSSKIKLKERREKGNEDIL